MVFVFDIVINGVSKTIYIKEPAFELAVGSLQNFLDAYVKEHKDAEIDYIHGSDYGRLMNAYMLYSMLTGKDTQQAVEFAVAASALKHSIEGDYNMVTVAEVEKLAGGDGSGRIQR